MNNFVQITAVLVVLLGFAFMLLAPSLWPELNLSRSFRAGMITLALGLMFTMGVWHRWKKQNFSST